MMDGWGRRWTGSREVGRLFSLRGFFNALTDDRGVVATVGGGRCRPSGLDDLRQGPVVTVHEMAVEGRWLYCSCAIFTTLVCDGGRSEIEDVANDEAIAQNNMT